MAKCKKFRTFKLRGEWVELRFMAQAMGSGFRVSKPWGDSEEYDVGVESGSRILRVQVKSTDFKMRYGFLCTFKGSHQYSLSHVDFFAAYIIPPDAWYIIPASVILGRDRKGALILCPKDPQTPKRYLYEDFKEAWRLMKGQSGQRAWLKKVIKRHGSLARLPKPVRNYARTISSPKRRRAAA